MTKGITILGSTGSIGVNCLDVLSRNPERFRVSGLSTNRNVDTLYEQAQRFRPRLACVVGRQVDSEWRSRFKALGTELLFGQDGLLEIAGHGDADTVVNALVGAAGLRPTLEAIGAGKNIALANKETLVMAGELVNAAAEKAGVPIIPIDSEHSAILQCLAGEGSDSIKRIVLTASGGPFRDARIEDLRNVTREDALNHPNWDMGPKITIDSATLMNKGLEVIEAHFLFGLPLDEIDVVIHPQSIIHSMVEFVDGSIKAQLGLPDMRLPIQYALSYPDRFPADFPPMDFTKRLELQFYPPDFEKFPTLGLAYLAARTGGGAPAVLNAANEVVVHAFLEDGLQFQDIPGHVAAALEASDFEDARTLEEIVAADAWAREFVGARVGIH